MADPAGPGLRIGLMTASASRLGGGVLEAVVAHCQMLRDLGHEPRVFALDDIQAAADRDRFGDTPVTLAAVRGPAQVGYAPALLPALIGADLDCLHLHGIWMFPSRAGAQWAERTGRPYLISPHGMLDPWITGRGRWKKTLARWGYERASWKAARAFHALTGREEADIVREAEQVTVEVIPNPAPKLGAGRAAMPGPHIVYVGRLHAKKNLLALIGAWRALSQSVRLPSDARLSIAGWGDPDHEASLRDAISPEDTSIRMCGPLFGEDKAALLRDARAVILPSLSEGLPMAMLEAWAEGIPTVMTDDCNLPEGFAAGAALRCGHAPGEIEASLLEMLTMKDGEWHAMSDAASGLAAGPFGAGAVAGRWDRFYRQILGAIA